MLALRSAAVVAPARRPRVAGCSSSRAGPGRTMGLEDTHRPLAAAERVSSENLDCGLT